MQGITSLKPMLWFLLSCALLLRQSLEGNCSVPNCVSCPSDPFLCEVCPYGKSCCQETCINCINQNTCTQCIAGYALSNSSVCELVDSCAQLPCALCENGECQYCMNNFVLNNETHECIACP